MNEPTPATCARCGAKLPAGDEPCPACMMSAAAVDIPIVWSTEDQIKAAPEFPRDLGGYRLLGLLGSGGMATVYEAEQLATGRRVALKVLGAQLDSPEMRQRFLREGRLAASVSHPNSLYVFGSEEIESAPVITMEIAAGGTLQDILKKRGPLPVKDAVDAILDVVSGLEAAFAGGVLHRDIKPSNCFVEPDGTVKVGDFGLSVSTLATDDSYATASGVIMGTPAFASPEQLRGDHLDLRTDIYSVGATLYALLTGRAPFSGQNAVQVVANAVNQAPRPVRELRSDVPPELDQVVTRCLAKEPAGRFENYMALRDALLPFSSREPEPASLKVRAAAGWIDFLIAFLVPYVPVMLTVGNEQFHFGFIFDRSLAQALPYLIVLLFGCSYFAVSEGVFGAGLGKRLKVLRVVGGDGRRPGIGRAFLRILIPIVLAEGVRIPLMLVFIKATRIDDLTTFEIVLYSVATSLCPWIPVLLGFSARRTNAFATPWDRASGTRVVVRQKGTARASLAPAVLPEAEQEAWLGPYRITRELVPGELVVAIDPLLRRQVLLRRRTAAELDPARRNLARPGRMRWLQQVWTADAIWDAFEATPGTPLSAVVEGGKRVPWRSLRPWLLDLATEVLAANGDDTLPAELSLDHVWISARGEAVLIDEPWPGVTAPAERIPVQDLAGQQRFLSAVADCVEKTGLPLHARPVLENLAAGRFERLSFLTGTLRGQRDRPVSVSRGIRAASIFLLPAYVWTMLFLGTSSGADWLYERVGDSLLSIAVAAAVAVLVGSAVMKLLALPFGTSISHATFRLAVVDARGKPASRSKLLARWAITWLPVLLPLAGLAAAAPSVAAATVLILLFIAGGVYAVRNPHRGLQDRLAGTFVVRR